jgi:hypothetical protein
MSARFRIVPGSLIVVAALIAGGSGKADAAEAQPSEAPQPVPAPPAQRKSPIVVSASANSSVQAVVAAGWPVVVEVMLLLKPDAGASLTLANSAGPWSDALKLECTGPDGADRSALFSPAYASERSIELTHERSGLMVWILDAVDPGSMPEGTYQIRAVVDEKKIGGTLPPGLVSSRVVVTVAPSPATPSPGAAQRKCLAMMNASAWKRGTAQALATAASYLTEHPKDVAVLFLQGKIQRAEGRKVEALASFEAALMAAEEHKEPMGENFAILEVVEDLQRELAPNEPTAKPLPAHPGNVAVRENTTPPPPTAPTPTKPTTPVPAPAAVVAARIASPEDARFRADSRGQWAAGAEASSAYRVDKYGAREATGEPNVNGYGDRPEAWASKTEDGSEEWLRLTFATPVRASAVRVRQNFNPGAIVKVEAFAADGRSAIVWSGHDVTAYPKSQTVWFVATFDPPPFPVQAIKLTLDSVTAKGWNEIDAVQLVGDP